MSAPELVGWAATALFAASYLCREPRTLRLVQGTAALVWIAYGLALHAAPVVAANAVVATLALGSSLGPSRGARGAGGA